MLRALFMAALGIPVCAALFTGAVTFLIYSYAQGEPPSSADLAGALAFGALSLIVVVLALRASRKSESVSPALSRAAPLLLFAGAALGAWGMIAISGRAFESIRASRESYCREHLESRVTDRAIALCLPEAKICDRETRASETGRSYDHLMRDCIDKRLGALVLMGKLPDAPRDPDDRVTSVYPAEVEEVPPLVDRLCDVLHGLPKRRKAECCERKPGVILTKECARNLASALADGSVQLAEADVDACEKAMQSAHAGCDWVGPNPPGVQKACLGILRGTRKQNDVCRSSLECRHGLRCLGAGPTERGRCGRPVSNGSVCNAAVDTLAVYVRQDDFERRHPACADGYCDRNRCVPKIRTGGPCKASSQCLFGRCAEGQCVDETTADVNEPCMGGDCVEGTRCAGGKCVDLEPLGSECTDHAECKAACVNGKCNLGCEEAPLLRRSSPAPRKGSP